MLRSRRRLTADRAQGRPTVAILETDPTGHRLQYLRYLHDAVGADRCVVLTTDRALRSEEYGAHAAETVRTAATMPNEGSGRATLERAIDLACARRASLLVVPDGDRYLTAMSSLLLRRRRLPVEVRLLLMRTTTIGGPEPIRLASMVKPLLVQLLRLSPQVHVLFLTDALGVVTTRPGYPGVPPVQDPVLPVSQPPENRPDWFPPQLPGRSVVGLFGVISPRKNLPLLVDAIASVNETTLVVAGRLEPEVRAFVNTSRSVCDLLSAGRMVVIDRLIGAAEFSSAIAASDLVAVLHDNDSPSGILAEACARHTPVLVPEGGWLAKVTTTTGIGVTTPLTTSGIVEGIQQISAESAKYLAATSRQATRMGTTEFTDALVCG